MIRWQAFSQPPRQGVSHKRQGSTPCQDKVAVKENNKVVVAVLSDGLGQLEYSGNASEAITNAVSTFLVNYEYKQLNEVCLKRDIIEECMRAMKKCSDDLGISITKMDCTLLFSVVFKNEPKYILGQLGDGAICLVKKDHALLVSVLEDKFKASSNLTKTILSSDALDYFNIKIDSTAGLVGLFLTSDGLENEIYSKAGKVKQNIQWYFNLISNNDNLICVNEIDKRWNQLTANDTYGFTDDMSLAVIFQPGINIALPEETNWLCICGHRNRMESSRCESCGKDITKVYKDINFKLSGGKMEYFSRLNKNPLEETRVVNKLCVYSPQKNIQSQENNNINKKPLEYPGIKQEEDAFQEGEFEKDDVPAYATKFISDSMENNESKSKIEIEPLLVSKDVHTYESVRKRDKRKILYVILALTCMSLFVFLTIVAFYVITSLQNENITLQTGKKELYQQIDTLNGKLSEQEQIQNIKKQLPESYSFFEMNNGDIYIGNLSNNLPNGVGSVYSSEDIMTGNFSNGKKNGTFYVLYKNGTSKIIMYSDDIEIENKSLLNNSSSLAIENSIDNENN